MGFASTAVAETSGTRVGCTEIAPHAYIVWGTWLADGDALGKIVTGLALIYDCSVTEETTASNTPQFKPNVDESGVAELGTIGVLTCGVADTGHYWAIGRL